MQILPVQKNIKVKLLKKLMESSSLKENEQIEIRKTIIEEYDSYELDIYYKGNKIGFIEDYWSEIGVGYAIDLDVIKQCNFSEKFSRFIIVKILLEAKFNEDIYNNLEACPGIYGIVDSESGRVYVGQTSNIKNRIKDHFINLSIGFHHNTNLQELYMNKKEPTFEIIILEKFSGKYKGGIQDRNWLEEAERKWIQHYWDLGKCLNKTKGEFIETNKTRQEKREIEAVEKENKVLADKAHDVKVSEQKKILKVRMSILQEKMENEEFRLKPLYDELENLRKWVLDNSSWFDFLKSNERKYEKRNKQELLENLELLLKKEESIYNECYREVKILKAELKKLKTSKQLNYASKRQADKVLRYIRGY